MSSEDQEKKKIVAELAKEAGIQEEKGIKKTKSFLVEDRQKFESLGCGCLDGIYYFGIVIVRSESFYPMVALER